MGYSAEEFDAEELQISEYLKTHVSDDKPVHGDSETNLPSEHTTDAFTFTSQCLNTADKFAVKPPRSANPPASEGSDLEREVRQDNRSDSDDVKSDVKSSDKKSFPLEPLDRPESNVHVISKTEKDICGKNHEKERHIASSVECMNSEVIPQGNTNLNEKQDSKQQTEHSGQNQGVTGPQSPSTASTNAQDSAMFSGRDDPGRGLARAPLGTPSSLAAPPPLGRPPLGAPPVGGGRVPPIGGQFTPLAPIAAASRGGPPQLVSATVLQYCRVSGARS